jgi:uncharacterized metal-binding protein
MALEPLRASFSSTAQLSRRWATVRRGYGGRSATVRRGYGGRSATVRRGYGGRSRTGWAHTFGATLFALSRQASGMTDDDLPLVYSCSGCSSAAQLANDVAVSLDRDGVAEMSCIAGVGGDVPPLVATATSGREIVAIDGCPLTCARSCLAQHDVEPDRHFELSSMGVAKEYHADYDDDQAAAVEETVREAAVDLSQS